MEAEAFPIRFTRGIRSYWRRRGYERVDGSSGRGTRQYQLVRLGGGSDVPRPWAVKVGGAFRARRATVAAAKLPLRVLGRVRDAYVDVMLGAAKAHVAAAQALPSAPEGRWQKLMPLRRSLTQARQKPEELGQRLVVEMYKSVLASKDLAGMLRSSSVAR